MSIPLWVVLVVVLVPAVALAVWARRRNRHLADRGHDVAGSFWERHG